MSQEVSGQESRVGYVVKRLQQVLRVAMDAALAEHNLSMAQFAALKSLQDGPLPAAELARRSFTTRQSMQDVLSCLRSRGFIEKAAPQPKGGRSQPIALTNHGRRVAEEADHAVRSVETRMTRGLTPPQQDQLQAWLTTCADNLQPGQEAS